MTSDKMKRETKAIRLQSKRSSYNEHSAPLHMTSSYVFDSAEHMSALFNEQEEGYIYSRYSNPNVTEFIDKIASLEGAEAGWATASGMAAIFSTFGAFCKAGDRILSARSVFGSTHRLFTEILPKWGIQTDYVAFDQMNAWQGAVTPETTILYLETPTNPGVDIIDLKAANEFAKKNGLLFIVDNCFATPVNQRPIEFGADLVIHSATKFFDGQGRTMGGVVVGKNENIKTIQSFARHTGPALSPFNAWTLSKSIETLILRVEKHNENALKLAQRLENHFAVNWVKYPFLPSHPQYDTAHKQMSGGGGIITFEVKGGIESGRRFLNSLQLWSLTANLGDSRSIATHPASTTHSKLTEEERMAVGITPGLVRLSVGLEHIDDIWEDLNQSLLKVVELPEHA